MYTTSTSLRQFPLPTNHPTLQVYSSQPHPTTPHDPSVRPSVHQTREVDRSHLYSVDTVPTKSNHSMTRYFTDQPTNQPDKITLLSTLNSIYERIETRAIVIIIERGTRIGKINMGQPARFAGFGLGRFTYDYENEIIGRMEESEGGKRGRKARKKSREGNQEWPPCYEF